ncbi:MAG: Methionine aminopeptidase [Candidatus Magasanikbacteria bacterium GW2011_GWC2_34_16]|uniref:Methionine aminopeptidase n=2 Tax=Candidatus Magasanikiibacteriota TaxID=1752731 RepID=A0A0G0HB08_9BACT|nr:MAG: Methionine aminopeptidase [Candidatus Magasanikbacteria bacterium GW2011_GWC2_34_16]KKQ40463.1 MAG: Methionine aminopeptidase [Candidatus Magasanikbacteria bacterium GW2011_GWA2_37_8]
MSLIKSKSDIKQLVEGGKIIGQILEKLGKMAKAGVSTWEIDQAAEKMILAAGGRPAFKGYKGYPEDTPFPTTICASCNHELVHGIAKKNVILKDGDIFTIDIGMEWPVRKEKEVRSKEKSERGCFTDTAITVVVGKADKEVEKLLRITRESLEVGIKAAQPGNSVADIGKAIEDFVKKQGNYGIVRDLVGHGVGHAVHEDPRVPNYYDKKLEHFILKPGMVIAIEPMISLGSHHVKTGPDGWTIVMADGSLCSHSEHTIVITEKGNLVITRRPSEK